MSIDSIADLVDAVRAAGQMALELQSQMTFADRERKSDHSVITQADTQVEAYLAERLRARFPGANLLAEESVWVYDPSQAYTFALDPVDGSDVYSQGMASWCVSLGLLDASLAPIAGMVYAPALDLFLWADVGQPATRNGARLEPAGLEEPLWEQSNVMVSSRVHHELDLQRYPGKIRCLGSAALHLCAPAVYPGIYATLQSRSASIWDLAGAHAILRSVGLEMEYLRGGPVRYAALVDGSLAEDAILAGSAERIARLRGLISRR
jgi:fructose-1,6-bisphosphatase/inositol monophosphatase family enzyme